MLHHLIDRSHSLERLGGKNGLNCFEFFRSDLIDS